MLRTSYQRQRAASDRHDTELAIQGYLRRCRAYLPHPLRLVDFNPNEPLLDLDALAQFDTTYAYVLQELAVRLPRQAWRNDA